MTYSELFIRILRFILSKTELGRYVILQPKIQTFIEAYLISHNPSIWTAIFKEVAFSVWYIFSVSITLSYGISAMWFFFAFHFRVLNIFLLIFHHWDRKLCHSMYIKLYIWQKTIDCKARKFAHIQAFVTVSWLNQAW